MAKVRIKKLTISSIGLKPKEVIKDKPDGTAIELCRWYGIVNRVKMTEDTKGNLIPEFHGIFEGENLMTGEIVTSAKMFVPQVAEGIITDAMPNGQAEAAENLSIQFAMVLRVKPHATSSTGYAYDAVNLIESEAVDPLAHLRAAKA